MLDWIIEGLRWIVWGFTAACLELMDVCYDLITKIASADFLSSKEVWSWYYSLMAFLGVLIFIRFFSVFLKVSFDEEFREKFSGVQVFNKIIAIGLVIGLLPMIVGGISNISVNGIKNISVLVGSSSIKEPSTFLITSFMNTDNGEFNEDGTWVEGNQTTYTLEDVDINEEGENDDYKFFNAIQDLFIMALLGVAASIMLIINGIQIGKRMFSLVMKILVAPLPISSMIVPGDETFTMWRKMIISDYLMNFVQTLMIMVVMILSSSTFVRQFGLWVQIIMFIAGLLLLLSGIPELAKIFGWRYLAGKYLTTNCFFPYGNKRCRTFSWKSSRCYRNSRYRDCSWRSIRYGQNAWRKIYSGNECIKNIESKEWIHGRCCIQ